MTEEVEDREQDKSTTQGEKQVGVAGFFKTQTDANNLDRPVGQGQFDYMRRMSKDLHKTVEELRKKGRTDFDEPFTIKSELPFTRNLIISSPTSVVSFKARPHFSATLTKPRHSSRRCQQSAFPPTIGKHRRISQATLTANSELPAYSKSTEAVMCCNFREMDRQFLSFHHKVTPRNTRSIPQ
jgi:hypothetical protein